MQIIDLNTRIGCKKCGWSGEASQLDWDKIIGADPDGPHKGSCPARTCKTVLANWGWLGMNLADENASIV